MSDEHAERQTRDFYDSHAPTKVAVYQADAKHRLRGADVGRTYSGRSAVIYLVVGITATVLIFNYLAQAARDAKPLRMPSPTPTAPQ